MKQIWLLGIALPLTLFSQTITVGSKPFTESYVLGEIAKRALENAHFQVVHQKGLGKSGIVWAALTSGSIDVYPEYTGTINEELLKSKETLTQQQMTEMLKKNGIGMTGEIGFNDGYCLAMRRDIAQKLNITKISDLKQHPELRLGLTNEFLKRKDGWEPLSAKYGLTNLTNVKGMEHSLGYIALVNGQNDILDAYTTDAQLIGDKFLVLEDNLHYFPLYRAVYLYRLNLPPKALEALRKIEGTINEQRMIALNAEAEKTKNYSLAAASYFNDSAQNKEKIRNENSFSAQFPHWLGRHLELVGISLFFSILFGIPLGIAAGRPGFLSQIILGITGVLQTIPSLALLALLVPYFGTNPKTAIIALFLYGLLPIVRNTATGLQNIPNSLRESGEALGLTPSAQLTKLHLPMASRTILAGIKTSGIIAIGTATLAALIGAGGLGEPIVSGLSLNDNTTILQGAIPAAILAITAQLIFDGLDRVLIPKGMRLSSAGD